MLYSKYKLPFDLIEDFFSFYQLPPTPAYYELTLYQDEVTKEHYYEFDLPGMKKEDIKISTEDKKLYISAERKDTKRQTKFEKTITLPKTLDISSCHVTLEAGVLKVFFKTKEAAESNRKEIVIP